MNARSYSPGGRAARWFYGIATGFALFSGFGQMPIFKRYYLADIPGLAWTANYYATSDIHYLAAALLLGMLAWRLALDTRASGAAWSWGPRTWWGWTLLGLLVISGAAKVLRNMGIFLPPPLIMVLDFTHLGSAMAFMFTGLVVLVKPKPKPNLRGLVG